LQESKFFVDKIKELSRRLGRRYDKMEVEPYGAQRTKKKIKLLQDLSKINIRKGHLT